MPKYRKKPVVIEAIEIVGGRENENQLRSFMGSDEFEFIGMPFHAVEIKTLEFSGHAVGVDDMISMSRRKVNALLASPRPDLTGDIIHAAAFL